MIARVARFSYDSLNHRQEAERNGTERVAVSLARQPGFQAIYYGRIAELKAFVISLFDSGPLAEAAGIAMNAEPLLPGQVSEMLPSPESVALYDVRHAVARDIVPAAGRFSHLTLSAGQDDASAERWAEEAFGPMLETVPGLSQAYFLRAADREEWISLTLWSSSEAMESGAVAIGAWHAGEAAAGRRPAFVAGDGFTLSAMRTVIAPVPSVFSVSGS